MSDLSPVSLAFDNYLDAMREMTVRRQPYASAVFDRRADLSVAAMRATGASDRAARVLAPIMVVGAIGSTVAASYLTADAVEFDVLWSDKGRPTFVVSASLAAQLSLTDCGRVAEVDVAWPFPAFRIVMPQPEPRIAFVDDAGVSCGVRHIDVVRWKVQSVASVTQLDANFASNSTVVERLLGDIRRRSEAHEGAEGICLRAHGERGFSIYQNAPWTGETDVADWLAFRGDGQPDAGSALRADYEMRPEDRRALNLCQRIAVNLALYLSSERENGDKVWTPASKTSGRPGRWPVDSDVRIGPEVRRAASEVAAGRPATAPAIKHIVRGHFRNQACGPQRAQRRRIYVAPHWRGEGEAQTTRRYQVE